jgi:predicted PurR-regulated permease PerM
VIAPAASGIDWRRVVRIAAIVGGVGVIVYVATMIRHTVEVFVLASLIAFGVNPVVRRLAKRMPRLLAIALIYLALVVLVLIAALIIVPDTINQVQAVFANSGEYTDRARQIIENAQAWFTARFKMHVLPPQFQDIEQHALNEVTTWAQTALSGVTSFVVGVVDAVIVGIAAVIISYYLLAHSSEMQAFYYGLFPDRSLPGARAFAREVARVFGGFMMGNFVLFAFTAALTAAVLAIFHSQYALLLGIVTGLLYLVPYLGLVIAIIFGMLLGLLQSGEASIIVGLVIFGVTRISDYIIAPKVMGESVDISPVTVIFALFAGGELFGIWGLVLAIPAAALVKVIWKLWIRSWLRGEAPAYAAQASEAEAVPAAQPAAVEAAGAPSAASPAAAPTGEPI